MGHPTVHSPTVLAATGPLGRALLASLQADGIAPIAVGRDAAKLRRLSGTPDARVADFADPVALGVALADASQVVCCGNAVHLPAILAALPANGVERVVVMGSTRCFSAVPDATADAVRRAEALLSALAVPNVMLLSSMIYGTGIGVVDMLARLAARWPLLPLPSRSLVQPIHIDDVVLALKAALRLDTACGSPIVIAGPAPMPYARMGRLIIAARGLRSTVLPVPSVLLGMLRRPSLRRLAEDAAFDVTAMRRRLGVSPRSFAP